MTATEVNMAIAGASMDLIRRARIIAADAQSNQDVKGQIVSGSFGAWPNVRGVILALVKAESS